MVNNLDGVVRVEGFATFTDAKTEDLVPWTPLRAGEPVLLCPLPPVLPWLLWMVCSLTGYSGLDRDSAVYLLTRIMKHFVEIIAEEARSLPDGDGKQ